MAARRGYAAQQGLGERKLQPELIFLLFGFIYIGFIVAVSL
jgi:hypothetical protein